MIVHVLEMHCRNAESQHLRVLFISRILAQPEGSWTYLRVIAVTDSGRPLPRVGGLTADEAKGEDGLR